MTIKASADNGIKIKILVFRPIVEIKCSYYKFVTFHLKQKIFSINSIPTKKQNSTSYILKKYQKIQNRQKIDRVRKTKSHFQVFQ